MEKKKTIKRKKIDGRDITYLFHEMVDVMRILSRDGKLEDYVFNQMHDRIEIILGNKV